MAVYYFFRQEPPAPQIILGVAVKIFGWPFSLPVVSFLLSVINLHSAFLIRRILLHVGFGLIAPTFMAVLWCLSIDSIQFEVSAYPSAMYELITAYAFLLSIWYFMLVVNYGGHMHALGFGFSCAMLIMTRATLSAFFIVPILISFCIKKKSMYLCGLIPIIFQLMLAFKNYYAYGDFHIETSSFSGNNFFSSIYHNGSYGDFVSYAKKNGQQLCLDYENFYVNNDACSILIDEAKKKDADLSSRLSLPEQALGYGSAVNYALYNPVKRIFFEYLVDNPEVAGSIIYKAYLLFWGRILDGADFTPGMTDSLYFSKMGFIFDGVRWVYIFAIHFFVIPVFFAVCLISVFNRKISKVSATFIYSTICFLYVALVSSIGDFSENNRYRYAIEPVIWMLPFLAFMSCKIFSPYIKNKFLIDIFGIKK